MESLNLDTQTLFAGGWLCLDFINTSCERRGAQLEFIGTGEELRRWLLQAEEISKKSLCPEDKVWESGYGESVLPRAMELRAALNDLVLSVIEKRPIPIPAMETVNTLLRTNPTYPQIRSIDGQFGESVAACHPEDTWLVTIAKDALDMLCHADLSLLRQCECATCVRVFYDTTKNHKRRWCVEKCSSQTKAAAYYRRKKAKREAMEMGL